MNKLIEKISWQLCAFCAASAMLVSCTIEEILPPPCVDGDCNAEMVFPVQADENGYYHIELDWTGEYLPYFNVDVFASKLDDYYAYNGVHNVEARFDSDTYWIIGDTLTVTVNNYNPFQGPYDYSGNLLPNSTTTVDLTQFAGMKVNMVQGTSIKFTDDHTRLRSRRTVGPIPPMAIGDTITLYMEVYWDAGSNSVLKNDFTEKFIVE
tara:strand:- start:24 stop:647 length:624 start_codon:yes stop_codon:yes gene_type:complete